MDVSSPAELDALLAKHKIVVIDYHADWCGPCKAYSPKFSRVEREMRRTMPEGSFVFASVDIDRAKDLARDAKVLSVPTTIAWSMGKGLFGGPKKKEVLRFSGDRSWPELVRTFTGLLESTSSR